MELIRAYWSMPLVSRLTLIEQARVLALVYALVFVSVVVLHLFLPGEGAGVLFRHAAQIAFGYLFWFALLGGVLAAAMAAGLVRWLRVWHVWTLSALCYVLGFFAASFDDALTITLHHDVDEPHSLFHFLRLLPVWLAVTWVFIGTYVGRSRREEIARLARLNERLSRRHAADPAPAAAPRRLQIEVGRTAIDLPVDALSHVSVDDHYCYLYHHHHDGALRKVALGIPLSELLSQLPDSFLQIHRSHAVHLPAVAAVERHGRGYRLRLEGVDELLPVSRPRIGTVLPRLEGRVGG